MTWDDTMLLSVLTWPACAGIFFIASCRLNAMPKNTRWPVVLEYSIWAAVGVGSPLLPMIGDWPGIGSVVLMYALLIVLLCSSRAWAGDVAPDEATDTMPLGGLSFRQRFDLAYWTWRAQIEAALRPSLRDRAVQVLTWARAAAPGALQRLVARVRSLFSPRS